MATANNSKPKELTFKHVTIGIIVLSLITLMNTCNSSSAKSYGKKTSKELDSLRKEIVVLQKEIDELDATTVSYIDLQIEGLNSELRAIEATDRRKIDMDRQGEIRAEIEKLKKEKLSYENK